MLPKLKARLQSGLRPIAASLPLSPNLITLLSIIAMIAAAYFAFQLQLILAALLALLSGFLDLLDGEVARAQRKATVFGSWLDKVADRLNDALLLGSITLAGLVDARLGVAALIIILLASYASLGIDALAPKGRNVGSALSMRGLRIVILAAGLAAGQVTAAVAIVILLGLVASAERLMAARRLLR